MFSSYHNKHIKIRNLGDNSTYRTSTYPSVLIPGGWDGDVLHHVHLLLLAVYLAVLISCLALILGIFLVCITHETCPCDYNCNVSDYSYIIPAMAGDHCAGHRCRGWGRWLDTTQGKHYHSQLVDIVIFSDKLYTSYSFYFHIWVLLPPAAGIYLWLWQQNQLLCAGVHSVLHCTVVHTDRAAWTRWG